MTAAAVVVAFTVAAVTLLVVGIHLRARADWVPAPKPEPLTQRFGPVRVIQQQPFDWETDE